MAEGMAARGRWRRVAGRTRMRPVRESAAEREGGAAGPGAEYAQREESPDPGRCSGRGRRKWLDEDTALGEPGADGSDEFTIVKRRSRSSMASPEGNPEVLSDVVDGARPRAVTDDGRRNVALLVDRHPEGIILVGGDGEVTDRCLRQMAIARHELETSGVQVRGTFLLDHCEEATGGPRPEARFLAEGRAPEHRYFAKRLIERRSRVSSHPSRLGRHVCGRDGQRAQDQKEPAGRKLVVCDEVRNRRWQPRAHRQGPWAYLPKAACARPGGLGHPCGRQPPQRWCQPTLSFGSSSLDEPARVAGASAVTIIDGKPVLSLTS